MNRKILALAIPNIISNITIPLLGMVDMAIVGHLGDDALIGGIAIGTAVFNFIYWNLAFLRMGTSGLAAQAYGAHDFREIAAILVRALSVALAAAMALLILQRPAGRLTLMMMDGTPHTMRYAAEYFFARIWAAPATISLFAFQGWYIGMQNSRFPMYIAIVINLINIVFCLWFTLGLGWGIARRSLGNGRRAILRSADLRRAVAPVLPALSTLHRPEREPEDQTDARIFPNQPRHFPADGLHRRRIHFFHLRIVRHGRHAAGGQHAANAAFHVVLVPDGRLRLCRGIAGGTLRRRPESRDARKAIRYLLAWSLVVAILYVGVYAFGWRTILSLFTDSTAILSGAGAYVEWLIVIPLIAFAPFMIDGILIGATRTAVMRNSVFVSTVVFFAAYYGLRGIAGNNALWFAFTAFLVMRGVLQYYMTNRLRII